MNHSSHVGETKNGKPSIHECSMAFSRIMDILASELDLNDTDDDSNIRQAYDIAAGFHLDLEEGI